MLRVTDMIDDLQVGNFSENQILLKGNEIIKEITAITTDVLLERKQNNHFTTRITIFRLNPSFGNM